MTCAGHRAVTAGVVIVVAAFASACRGSSERRCSMFELYALDGTIDVPAVGQSPPLTRAAIEQAMVGKFARRGRSSGCTNADQRSRLCQFTTTVRADGIASSESHRARMRAPSAETS